MFEEDPIKLDRIESAEQAPHEGRLGEIQDEARQTRDQQLAKLADQKVTLAQADEAGLDDDPLIAELRERVEAVEKQLGFTDASDKLQDAHGLDPDVVDRVPESDHAELLETLDRAERVVTSAGDSHYAEHEAENIRDTLQTLAPDGVVAPKLAPEIEGLQAALKEAELSAGDEPDELSGRLSDRQKVATLQDREEELEAKLADAADLFEEAHLEEKLDAVDDALAELKGDGASTNEGSSSAISAENLKR